MSKKVLASLLAVLLCAFLAACGSCTPAGINASSAADDNAPPSSPPGVMDDGSNPADTASPAGTVPGAAPDASTDTGGSSTATVQTESSVTGVIEGAGMGSFQVKLEDGLVLDFPHEDADVSELEDTRPGAKITVYFYGTLKGNDTSGLTVTRMVTPK